MSSFDASDPFDNGQQWQNVPTDSNWSRNNLANSIEEQLIPEAPIAQLAQPSAPSIIHSAATSTTPPPQQQQQRQHHQSTAAEVLVDIAATTSTHAASIPTTFEDLPPSYEATVVRDIPQIHDNYDHLRGPVGQRGVDLKTRIPLDSTPASHYQAGGSNDVGSSSRTGPGNNAGARYGSISPPQSSPSRLVNGQTTSPNNLNGQVSHGRDDDGLHSQDVDRLLGPSDHRPEYRSYEEEEPLVGWGIVGDSRAWIGLAYLIVILFPWALFCFVWTLVTAIISAICMIFPPVGYVVMITSITSWRALARVDLVISRSLVAWQFREKHPYTQSKIFVRMPNHTHPIPDTQTVGSTHEAPGTPEIPGNHGDHDSPAIPSSPHSSHRSRIRRSNLWQRLSEHLKLAAFNKHTLSTLSYFLIWKFIFALAVFPIIVVFFIIAIPFMVCLLPTLLLVCRKFINGQFRWSIFWLAKKSQPIALP
ncbi:hypothetical protein BGZ76_001157 [Entomortierella beljakovae]|nr:hypothetical protein BGZ76_001157 [Entomortierella beljakovae]